MAGTLRTTGSDTTPPRIHFVEQVAGAIDRTGILPSPQACAYLVDLLAEWVPPGCAVDAPAETECFTELLWVAQAAQGADRRARLRALADAALVRVGFYPDSCSEDDTLRIASVARAAYTELAELAAASCWERARLFEELAECFEHLADVLTEVGDVARAARPDGLGALCDRYLRHERPADRMRLVRRGLVEEPRSVAIAH